MKQICFLFFFTQVNQAQFQVNGIVKESTQTSFTAFATITSTDGATTISDGTEEF
jgi:hypothetical protein